MKIATWNVNSLNVRLPHVLSWLERAEVDILALQETKCTDDNFPLEQIQKAGFQVVFNGQKSYNGVAIIAKNPITEVISDLTNYEDYQRRVLFATVGGIRILNVYIPNGSEVGSEKYFYKLQWLQALQLDLIQNLNNYKNTILLGDFNIAPRDEDLYDPVAWCDKILCSKPERAAFQGFLDAGMVDTFLQFEQAENQYSWWDYRQAAFRRNLGMRIDFILASTNLSKNIQSCVIDKEPRTWQRPSDHAPVIADFKIDL